MRSEARFVAPGRQTSPLLGLDLQLEVGQQLTDFGVAGAVHRLDLCQSRRGVPLDGEHLIALLARQLAHLVDKVALDVGRGLGRLAEPLDDLTVSFARIFRLFTHSIGGGSLDRECQKNLSAIR